MDSQNEVGEFFKKLQNWRKESEREFSKVIDTYSIILNNRIKNLVEEISELKNQLSVITQERDDMKKTVNNLNSDIRQLSSKLPKHEQIDELDTQSLNTPEVVTPDNEEGKYGEEDLIISNSSAETGDQDEFIANGDILGDENKHTLNFPYYSTFNVNDTDIEYFGRFKEENKDIGNIKQEGNVQIDDHMCQECKVGFSTSENLKMHLKNVHSQLKPIMNSESDKKREDKNLSIRTHMIGKSHHNKGYRNFNCEECPYTTSQKANLKAHIIGVHEKMKKYICQECGYAALQKSGLKQHVAGVHEKIKNHDCQECGYSASMKSNLKQHIEQVHEKIRNHFCGECGYSASVKSKLKRHIEGVHTKIRSHVCGKCKYATSQKVHLKKHMETVHEVEKGNKKFTCENCPYKATQKGHLEKHIKTLHDNIRN